MKERILKLFLVLALMIPLSSFVLQQNEMVISAKISGDYAYEVINDSTAQIVNYNGSAKELVVPEKIDGYTITRIGYGAFAECKSIEKLVIPSTIKVINDYAFSQCTQIREVEIPNSITTVGRNVFAGCQSLVAVSIPNSIKTLGYGLFFDCTALESVTLPEGLETIGGTAFGNCSSLKAITLPNSLMNISGNAFNNCTSLETIVIPEGVTSLGSGVFLDCLSLKDITLPETMVGIGQNAFQNCISLEAINLPESLTALGYGAFSGCSSLKQVNIPSQLTSIQNATFSGCSSMEEITIPDNITTMGEYVFSGCSSLKIVNLSNKITEIGASTFSDCSSLKSIQLPKALTELSSSLFRYCEKLESVIIPSGVKKIGDTVFADCENLRSVTFPEVLVAKSIGNRIFSNAPNVTAYLVDGSDIESYMKNNNYNYNFLDQTINFDKDALDLKLGETSQFTVILSPYTILDNKQLTWQSSNQNVVSVNAEGIVSAVGIGQATITAKNANGNSTTCVVSVDDVKIPIASFSINASNLTMKKESSVKLKTTINPTNTTEDKTIKWESSNADIVLVNSTGTLTAKRPGTATITAKLTNGMTVSCVVEVTSDIQSVSLNQTAMILDEGVSQKLRATINPSDTTSDKALTWSSSNTSVATVDDDGLVRTVAEGVATISVKSTNGKIAQCRVTVTRPTVNVPITSVTLDKTTLKLQEEATGTLVATINPSNTTDSKTLVWTSSDAAVATVNNGVISAKKAGTTTITVTTSNGKTASCTLTVEKKPVPITSVTLDKTTLKLQEEATGTLVATINPSNTTDSKTLVWTSSDTAVATVNNGVISAKKAGTTTITVTTSNGKTASCELTVEKKPVPITSVTLDKTTAALKKGMSLTLVATINPSETTDSKTLVWTSSDTTVATVNNGVISAKKVGTTTIMVTTSNGKSATCTITVEAMDYSVLETLIKSANDILNGDISDISSAALAKLEKAVEVAQKIISDGSYDEDLIAKSIDELTDAIEMTKQILDKSELQYVVDYVNLLDFEEYSVNTWEALIAEKVKAEAIIKDENATYKQVVEAYEALNSKIKNLKPAVSKGLLDMYVTMSENVMDNSDKYIANTIKDLPSLLVDAKALQSNRNATQEQVNMIVNKLVKAMLKARLK